MLLPEEFIKNTREIMGEERFQRYLKSFDEDTPVSIRLNPLKVEGGEFLAKPSGEAERKFFAASSGSSSEKRDKREKTANG